MFTDSGLYEFSDEKIVALAEENLWDLSYNRVESIESIIDQYKRKGAITEKQRYFLAMCVHRVIPIWGLGFFPPGLF